ncbi:MAG: hypothetical protein JNM04_02665 [Chthonomonas sp.]|nr:hypothetical protein [Chthonomonas sp.]
MKSVRLFVWIAAGILVFGGYFASQIFVWNGQASEWAHRVDTPQVSLLAAVLVVASLVGFFDRSEAE